MDSSGDNLLTTLECILREPVLSVEVGLDADESPAAGDVRWVLEAAAAIGSENKDTKREEAVRRNAEANTLAAVRLSRAVCCCGMCRCCQGPGGGLL